MLQNSKLPQNPSDDNLRRQMLVVGITRHLESGTSILASTQPVTAFQTLVEPWLVTGCRGLQPLARESQSWALLFTGQVFALCLGLLMYKAENTMVPTPRFSSRLNV